MSFATSLGSCELVRVFFGQPLVHADWQLGPRRIESLALRRGFDDGGQGTDVVRDGSGSCDLVRVFFGWPLVHADWQLGPRRIEC